MILNIRRTKKWRILAPLSATLLIGMLLSAPPLFAVTVDYTVNHDDDDGWERGNNGAVNRGGDEVRIYSDTSTSSSDYLTGAFRWANVAVPQGATITAAYISLYPNDSGNQDINHNIHFHDVDNSGALTSSTNDSRIGIRLQLTQHGQRMIFL